MKTLFRLLFISGIVFVGFHGVNGMQPRMSEDVDMECVVEFDDVDMLVNQVEQMKLDGYSDVIIEDMLASKLNNLALNKSNPIFENLGSEDFIGLDQHGSFLKAGSYGYLAE